MKLSEPTADADDGTDDCASGADDVAVPAKVRIEAAVAERRTGSGKNAYIK